MTKKISELTARAAADGSGLLEVAAGGTSYKMTEQAMKDYVLPRDVNAYAVNHTLDASDAVASVELGAATQLVLIVPTDATWPAAIGTSIPVKNTGIGNVLLYATPGVTVANAQFLAPGDSGILTKRSANTWFFSKSDPALLAGTDATSHLTALMRTSPIDLNVLILSDSTATGGGATDRWPGKLFTTIGLTFPEWTVLLQRVSTTAPNDTWNASPFTLQTGTGARTLNVWNASVASWTSGFMFGANRWEALVNNVRHDLVIFAHCHNEGAITVLTETGDAANSTAQASTTFVGRLASFIGLVRQSQPTARVLVLVPNPVSGADANNSLRRTRLLATVAALTDSSYIDASEAFTRDPSWSTNLMTDAVHPNAAGQTVLADELARHFVTPARGNPAPNGVQPSFVDRSVPNLLTNGDLVQTVPGTVDSWTATNVTPSQEVTLFESEKGYSTRLDAAGAAVSYLSQVVVPTAGMRRLHGKYVTFAVRMYVPTLGQTGVAQGGTTVGFVYLNMAGAYTTFSSSFTTNPVDGWCWKFLTARVPAATTSITARIYTSIAATAAARIYADRAVLVPGLLLSDPVPLV